MEFACPFLVHIRGKSSLPRRCLHTLMASVEIFFGATAEANIRGQKMHRHSTGQSDCLFEDAVRVRAEALRIGSASTDRMFRVP
jgi:hypothetical protein